MSDKTLAAIENAVAAHMAETIGDTMLMDWVVVAVGKKVEDFDSQSEYMTVSPDTSQYHSVLGLLSVGVDLIDGDRD